MDPDTQPKRSRIKLVGCATLTLLVLVCGLFATAGFFGVNVSRLFASTTLQVQSSVCGTWEVVSTPPIDMFASLRNVNSVAASPAGDVWLAGSVEDLGDSNTALFARWNDSRFERVAGPDVKSSSLALYGMDISPAGDVWAVGSEMGSSLFTLHWDGRAWEAIPPPQVSTVYARLYGVAAISPRDVWVVGHSQDNPVKAHWDGAQWSVITPTVPLSGGGYLNSVAAIAPDDVWAVGGTGDSFGGEGQTLIEHWDGKDWSIVPSPNLCQARNSLQDVEAIARDDVWAVGHCSDDDNIWSGPVKALIMHWDGKTWSLVQSPSPSPSQALLSISAASHNDIWAVGLRHNLAQTPSGLQLKSSGSGTLAMHWDGSRWDAVPSPRITEEERFSDVAVVSSGEVWAVGESQNDILAARFSRSPCPAGTGSASP